MVAVEELTFLGKDAQIEDIDGAQFIKLKTDHGAWFYVPLPTILMIIEGAKLVSDIMRNAQAILTTDKTQELLGEIVSRLEEIKTLLTQIIDLLRDIGSVIREENRIQTMNFLQNAILAQIQVLQTRLPGMQADPDYAKREASEMLRDFEIEAAKIRLVGCAPFQTCILAMVYQRELYRFKGELKATRVLAFTQYAEYFGKAVLGDSPDSLTTLLKHSETSASIAAAQLNDLIKITEIYGGKSQSIDDAFICSSEVWYKITGDLNSEFHATSEERNRHCSPRGSGRPQLFYDPKRSQHFLNANIQAELAVRNGLRTDYLNHSANAKALLKLIENAQEAADVAKKFIAEATS